MDKNSSTLETCSTCDQPAPSKSRKGRAPLVRMEIHPDHSATKTRINRVKGQLDAVSRMIDERQYCPKILQQVRAATNALRGLEAEILKGHLRGCVKKAMETKSSFETNDKIDEIIQLWNR
jgi:DNA-binding FrmR family transcriptional regulator